MTGHLDDLALLFHLRREGSSDATSAPDAHLAGCESCRRALEEARTLDATLQGMAQDEDFRQDFERQGLPVGDPFRLRPPIDDRVRIHVGAAAIEASDAGLERSAQLWDSLAKAKQTLRAVRKLDLSDPATRYALYYAVQESAKRIAESPTGSLRLAAAVLSLPRPPDDARSDAEAMLPWESILGQAHLLAAQASLWTRAYDAVRLHALSAYRALGRAGDETALAVAELAESQRRSFLGEGREALVLALRSRHTFRERGLATFEARALVTEGLAWAAQERYDEAIGAYRQSLPTFEEHDLWSNYVGAVNSLATALYRSGRLSEARREFARVFRRLSRQKHRSWLGYLRQGLGDVLLAAGRFREAAASFERAAELYRDTGLRASAIAASLAAAESVARSGDRDGASDRMTRLTQQIRNDRSLEALVRRRLLAAITKANKSIEEISELRQRVISLLPSSR